MILASKTHQKCNSHRCFVVMVFPRQRSWRHEGNKSDDRPGRVLGHRRNRDCQLRVELPRGSRRAHMTAPGRCRQEFVGKLVTRDGASGRGLRRYDPSCRSRAAFRRRGPSRNKRPASSCATTAAKHSITDLSAHLATSSVLLTRYNALS
jgi:hypothetical protein